MVAGFRSSFGKNAATLASRLDARHLRTGRHRPAGGPDRRDRSSIRSGPPIAWSRCRRSAAATHSATRSWRGCSRPASGGFRDR